MFLFSDDSVVNILKETIGLNAGMLTTLSCLPQLIKSYKTKSTQDISMSMYVMLCIGFLLWIVYGVFMDSISLILTNVISFALSIPLLFFKYKWEYQRRKVLAKPMTWTSWSFD